MEYGEWHIWIAVVGAMLVPAIYWVSPSQG